MYFECLKRCRIRLPRDEEARLARAMRRGDQEARRLLIESQLPYVVLLAKPLVRPHLPLEDLCQVGMLGLIECLSRFDPAKGRLSTWCSQPVFWRMANHVKRHCTVVSRPSTKPRAAFLEGWQRAADVGPLASAPEASLAVVADAAELWLEADERTSQLRRMDAAMGLLPPRMAHVLRGRLAGLRLRDLAEELCLTSERIRQLEQAAIKRLKRALRPAR